MKTERVYILENPEPPTEGIAVGHVYRLDDDPRRYTDFYICGNPVSAENLVISLYQSNRNDVLDEAMQTINNVGLDADDNAAVIIAIKALKSE